jgi:hypothetical protein
VTLELPNHLSILQLIRGNAAMLFLVCLLCHFSLYRSRPHPRHLTSFYLMISAGGAAGGALVSLAAPAIFPDYWEYHLALLAGAGIATAAAFRMRGKLFRYLRYVFPVLTAGLAVLLGISIWGWVNGSIATYRNFFGVLRVREIQYEDHRVYNLVHGRIIHGSQSAEGDYRSQPTRYYSPSTGIGLAFEHNARRVEGQPLRAGMVGLGIGTVAAYGQPGDTIRFYEINPVVIDIAQDDRLFSYLEESQAEIEIIFGDARLSMENEREDPSFEKYDLLAVDAFSGDSIPTHLINKEAVGLYLSLLADDGILAIHISNRYIDLEPVVGRLAQEYGLYSGKYTGGSGDWLGTGSTWIMLGSSPVALGDPALTSPRQSVRQQPGLSMWTDDYSNLFQVIRR